LGEFCGDRVEEFFAGADFSGFPDGRHAS
jgi:hypothetical protein